MAVLADGFKLVKSLVGLVAVEGDVVAFDDFEFG